jgi:POT family proton-dependent oligopeptide transporter
MIYEAERKQALLGRAFSYFYAAINAGSALASLGLPLVRERWGYPVALALPAGMMAVSFALFVAGRRHYPAEPPRRVATPGERAAARAAIRGLAPMFGLIAVFWFVYDQTASTWVFFARDFADLRLWGDVAITPDQIQGCNPVFILVLTPVFHRLWRWLAGRAGAPLSDPRKMHLGFWIVVVTTLGMAVLGAIAVFGRVSAWWLLGMTFVITLAELCISVVGLELAYRRAPAGARSAITGAFLATTFVGDLFGGLFAQLYGRISPGGYFLLQAVIAGAAALAFGRVARRDAIARRSLLALEAAQGQAGVAA